MVTFGKNHFSIKIETTLPGDDYRGTVDDIIDILQCDPPELQKHRLHLLELLRHMMPSEEQANLLAEKQ